MKRDFTVTANSIVKSNYSIQRVITLVSSWTIIFFITALAPSCVKVKSTFVENYKTKVKISPSEQVVIMPSNESVVLVGSPKSLLFKEHTAIGHIEASNGQAKWVSRAHKLGPIVSTPSNVVVLEDQGIALLFGYTKGTLLAPVRYQILAIDLNTQQALWSREERPGSGFKSNGFYLPKNNSYIIETPDGMQSFDIKTGKVLWDINDLSFNVNIGGVSLRLLQSRSVNFIYLEELDRFFLQAKGKIYMFDPYTGKTEWDHDALGDIQDADLFIEDGFAVFYGPQGRQRAQTATTGQNNALGIASRAISATDKSLQFSPIYLLDLKTGKVRWRSDYHTNGQSKVLVVDDRLIVTGLVSYAFDLETGEKLWQNIPASELNKEGIYSLFGEFTGFDLSASGRTTKDAQVVGNSIFVVYPELFDNRSNRNQVSIRLYDFEKKEMVWKTEGKRITVRDFFFKSGLIFYTIDGRFSTGSTLVALDPYTGEQLYEIDTREPLRNLIFTENLIYHTNIAGKLTLYNIRTGKAETKEMLGGAVIDIMEMDKRIMVVYNNWRKGYVLAFHDRNNFNLISQVELPFYSRNFETVNNQFFIRVNQDKLKGIAHVDLDKMEVIDHISVSTNGTKSAKGQSRNIILDPYTLVIDNDAKNIYGVMKNKLIKYEIKSINNQY
jgi:outer membrane protein assembly factor BamB